MKRLFLASAVILFLAAADRLPSEVRRVLEDALAGERTAVARYEAYAIKADEEGYKGAAALFRAQARAERTHAERFAKAMKGAGMIVPDDNAPKPTVNATDDNLRIAASVEGGERDGMYRDAVDTCKRHGATELAKLFEQARDSETEHANLCAAAARNLGGMKDGKTYYVCSGCGYTTDVKLGFCPSCRLREPLDGID